MPLIQLHRILNITSVCLPGTLINLYPFFSNMIHTIYIPPLTNSHFSPDSYKVSPLPQNTNQKIKQTKQAL